MKQLLFILLFLFLPAFLWADKVTVTLMPDKVTVGQNVQAVYHIKKTGGKLKVLRPRERLIFLPSPKKENDAVEKGKGEEDKESDDPSPFVPLFEITDLTTDNTQKDLIKATVSFTCFRPGKVQISLLTIKEDDEVIPYKGPLLTVEPVNKDGKLADIAPPMELGGNHTRLIALIAGAVLLGALVALGIVAWRKRKAKTAEPEPVNPYDYFSTEMEKLNPRELIEKRETEEYAYRLSLLFRQYLSYLYQVDMLELTTDEITKLFSSELKGRISTRYARGALKLMEMWDLIKFAEFDPDRELLEINLSEAGELAEKIYRGHGNNSIQQS